MAGDTMDDVVCCDWMQRHSADCNLVDAWLLVDAGVGNIRLRLVTQEGATVSDRLSPSNTDLRQLFAPYGLVEGDTGQAPRELLITGKLGTTVRDILGRGQEVLPSSSSPPASTLAWRCSTCRRQVTCWLASTGRGS